MKVLIVEDEPSLRGSIFTYLQREDNVCEIAQNYATAHQKINVYEYDCILVDITLPDGNGLKLIDTLKKNHSEAGIIIISAKDSLDDRVKGLDLGADDYLTKPFHLSELNARLKALARRKRYNGDHQLQVGNLTIYPDKKEVYAHGRQIELTYKEYKILDYFVTNVNRVLTKEAIAEHVWGDHYDMVDSFDFIYVHIRNLRKKLGEEMGEDPIKTIYGMGYKYWLP